MINLTLKHGGILEREVLDPVEDKHFFEDVTEHAICYLFYPVKINENVLLKDLFLLLNTNLEIFDSIFGNWCKDWVFEGLKEGGVRPEKLKAIYLEHDIAIEKYKDENELVGTECPRCHLLGDDDQIFGIGNIPAQNLAQLQLLLKEDGTITKNVELSFNKCSFTLGQVIHGILWELSWHGSPSKSGEFWDEMEERIKNIKLEELEELP